MEYITLANGVKMPLLGYGVYQVDPAECERCVTDAIAVGYRSIDTAQAYGNEAGVGEGIRRSGIPREEIFVTSKVAAEHKSYATAAQSIQKPAVPAFRLTWFKATPPFLSEPAGRTGPFRRRRST